ncbi:MAG: type IV pilus twitching motility protein PilT [Sumerlaeia bacterium]
MAEHPPNDNDWTIPQGPIKPSQPKDESNADALTPPSARKSRLHLPKAQPQTQQAPPVPAAAPHPAQAAPRQAPPSAPPAQPAPPTQPAPTQAQQPEVSAPQPRRISLRQLLREAVERGASDLHLTRGIPPMLRLDGYLVPLDYPALQKEHIEKLVMGALTDIQKEKFEKNWELDLSLEFPDAGRFRVNIHRQRGGTEAAFRVVNEEIQSIRRLGLPGVVEEIARKHVGLNIVTGPTGSGKSTSLAAIVDQINNERQCMVITIEDPIEYVHKNRRSIIKQRELNSDTLSFSNALRHVLRQDPDVIVVGEMRDLETIRTALMAAETGHLVFTTLHTPDATQTMDRIIDVFPPNQQEQTRIQVSSTLISVMAQQLIPVPGNRGRVVACEILIANNAVRKIIRTGKTEQLYTVMQTSWDQGMITMDKSLKTLYQQGLISYEDAITRCKYPSEFEQI